MKVVLDTNIFISGIHWSGGSEKILRAWFSGKFILVISPEIISEITETLASFRVPMEKEDIAWWKKALINKSLLVAPSFKVDVVKSDPDDNKFIEAALSGNADYIITQDKHLLDIKNYEGIAILPPNEFLAIFSKI
ncbi:MAG TPA: putative toxin-antitoxin system toxin component, PIN family [Candidatus Nanoarchaeia archaeon]|nr:putative toxin-antitoxin system toxin component, PIN family [Candidatus Nanoarchaeia archaeon]